MLFKLIVCKTFSSIKSEAEVLEELYENLEFYDDYEPSDFYTNFTEAFILVCDEFISEKNNNLIIQGYGIDWYDYKKCINDIFPELLDVIWDIRRNKNTKLVFYSLGNGRVINFDLSMINHANDVIYSKCTSLRSSEILGIEEIVNKNNLITQLSSIVNTFMLFAKSNYPLIYKKFLYPYLKEYGFEC